MLVSATKCVYAVVMIYVIITNNAPRDDASSMVMAALLTLAALFLVSDLFEKYQIIIYLVQAVVIAILYVRVDTAAVFFAVPLAFDLLVFFRLSPAWGMLSVCAYALAGGEFATAFVLVVLFFSVIYYLIYVIINEKLEQLAKIAKKEQKVSNTLFAISKKHSRELAQASLKFENMRLAELSELSQKLHDKIGHAITGSVFKLEGAKLLMEADSQRALAIIDEVITVQRSSMDEIRALLRREKPDAGEISLNTLKGLLLNFTSSYDIETDLRVDGDLSKIPAHYWGILLENTAEALTNSLKYSGCTKITAEIHVFPKIIRCQIRDNGYGASEIQKGMGIIGMEERLAQVGGSVSVSGADGFELNMLLPI